MAKPLAHSSPPPPLRFGPGAAPLTGFHHSTDERDLDDPAHVIEPYTVRTSGRWDALFDAPPTQKGSKGVRILAASYGKRDGDVLSNGEVGLGLRWVEEGDDESEARWGWIWGELEEGSGSDEDEDEEGDEVKEKEQPFFKGVMLIRAKKEEEDDNDENGADEALEVKAKKEKTD